MKVHIACFLWTLALISSALADFKPIEGVTLEEMLGGDKVRRILTTSHSIQVLRLGKSERQNPPAKFAAADAPYVIAALTDVKNYGGRYLCDFDPGVKLRFFTDEGTLDIVICFTCGEMRLYLDGTVVKRNIRWVGSQNSFSPVSRRAFVSLARKAFPDDKQIQSLHQ